MATLYFMCPTTGNVVDTSIDLDPASFAILPRDRTELSCPHCNKSHILAGVSAWLGELQPELREAEAGDAANDGDLDAGHRCGRGCVAPGFAFD
jgi:hypothetical protein